VATGPVDGLEHHDKWPTGQTETAAAGGADRRSAKNADRPINQSREALLAARPLHFREGQPVAGCKDSPCAEVCHASENNWSPRRDSKRSPMQHAPKARPLSATDRGRRGVVPGRRSRANGLAVGACAVAGCRTFALDRRAARPASTTAPRASRVASMPGETSHRDRRQGGAEEPSSQPQNCHSLG
jgi:hypothetical protein